MKKKKKGIAVEDLVSEILESIEAEEGAARAAQAEESSAQTAQPEENPDQNLQPEESEEISPQSHKKSSSEEESLASIEELEEMIAQAEEDSTPSSKKAGKKGRKKRAQETAEEFAEVPQEEGESLELLEEVSVTEEGLELSEESSEERLEASSEETVEVSEELLAEAETQDAETQEAAPQEENVEEEAAPSHKITDLTEIEQAVEALIFAAPKAMSNQRLRAILAANNFDTSCLGDVIKSIEHKFSDRGFNLIKVAGGFQFRSHPKHADILEKLVEDKPQRLSTSALEVLAIVAYKQPVTRAEIDAIRGVDSGHLLRGLLEKNLARTEGHAETTGRPLLYGTTPYFLEVFSLNSLDDLPALEEFQRELVEKAEGSEGDAATQSLEAALLASDPNYVGDNSALAANPDRGAFDEVAEERFENADFGLAEIVQEEDQQEEQSESSSLEIQAEA